MNLAIYILYINQSTESATEIMYDTTTELETHLIIIDHHPSI